MRRLANLQERASAPGSFALKISLGNEAMQTGEDVARALRKVADKLDRGEDRGRVVDDNGNAVGEWGMK